MTFWKTPSFKALQQAWYQRLRDEGFEDIEEFIGEELELKDKDLRRAGHRDYMRAEYDAEYFHVISQKVHETEFRNDVERLIMLSHSEGKKAVTICEELKQRGTPRHRHAIRFIVRRYEAKWELKTWSPTQLGKKVS